MKALNPLPESWIIASLEDVVLINPKHNNLEDQLAGFVPMKLAPTDFKGALHYEERQWDKIKKGYTHFATGDVIFAKVTPCFENGKAAIVKQLPNGIGAGSTEFYVLRPVNSDISVDYIFSIIKSYEFLHSGAENMTGAVGLRRVPKKFVENYKINLPPPAEQKEIVAQLDKLLGQVESTKTHLDATPAILKRFRQSVLAAAVSGKLTEEWRERRECPWKVVLLGEIIDNISQGWSPKCDNEPVMDQQWGVIKTSSVQEIKFIQEENKRLPEQLKVRGHLKIVPGDILTTRAGPRVRCGVTCYVEKVSSNLMISDKVYRYQVTEGKGVSKFLAIQLSSISILTEIEELKTGISESGMNLTQTKFKQLKIRWPLPNEQAEIVRRVEELFAYADKIEAQVNTAQQRVNNLTQSILAKAFSGELTAKWREQNPELISGENSATALLEKIKDERAIAIPKRKVRNKT